MIPPPTLVFPEMNWNSPAGRFGVIEPVYVVVPENLTRRLSGAVHDHYPQFVFPAQPAGGEKNLEVALG